MTTKPPPLARRATWVEVAPEHFIPPPKKQIAAALERQMFNVAEVEPFRDFVRLLEAHVHADHHAIQEDLAEDYAHFDGRYAGPPLAPEAIAAVEMRFLERFVHVLERANFVPLVAKDLEVAQAESFAFNLPVEIDWRRIDEELLPRFLARHPPVLPADLPEFARHVLVFRRGTGIERLEGRLILHKVDAVLTRSFERLAAMFGRRRADAAQASAAPPPRAVERIGVRQMEISARSFFGRVRLQEPTFAQLVLVYRPIIDDRECRPPGAPARPGEGCPHPIVIKLFRDIPMADLEVVFPEKRLSMKAVDLIKLACTGMVGLGLVALKLLTAALNPVLAIGMIATLLGYIIRITFGYKQSKERYHSLVTQSLYHKSLDSDRGVIYALIDAVERQEVKEMVLAYFFLWQNGTKTQAELDAICERFLHEAFDVAVDFEVDDALAKLVDMGLVVKDHDTYTARDLGAALERLDQRWDERYSYRLPAAVAPKAIGLRRDEAAST